MAMLMVADTFRTAKKEVVLTFDDGPNPYFTPAVLEVLRAENCPAAFFVIGRWAEQNPDLLHRIAQEGHIVGGHSYYHGGDKGRDPYHQFIKGNETIESLLGKPVRYIRVPQLRYRSHDAGIRRTAELLEGKLKDQLGHGDLKIVGASVGTFDWIGGVPATFNKWMALGTLRPGAIVDFHDGSEKTQDLRTRPMGMLGMLRPFIQEARKRGYRFVTLDQVELEMKPKTL